MQNPLKTKLRDNLKLLSLKHSTAAPPWQVPSSWPDIRNSAAQIALLATNAGGSCPKLGFSATVTGGYSVYINGVKYADFASSAVCSIDWAAYSATTGRGITTPAAYTAHIIEIYPKVNGNNISAFRGARIAASGEESQGILWAHFNITNVIQLNNAFGSYSNYKNPLLHAITAKNNRLLVSNCFGMIATSTSSNPLLSYLPVMDLSQNTASFALSDFFCQGMVKEAVLKGITSTVTSMRNIFNANPSLKRAVLISCDLSRVTDWLNCHFNNRSLVKLPAYNYAAAVDMGNFITDAVSLADISLNLSAANSLTRIGCYGSAAYPMRGFKGLKVSSAAPFTGSAPQINLSYTGMDRAALLALFASLPTVSAGQVCVITGASGAAALTPGDIQIATGKGWTVTA